MRAPLDVLMAAATLAGVIAVGAGEGLGSGRGGLVEVKDRAGAGVALYKESHALVIGVSAYTGGWPRLRGVAKDVPLVKAALEGHGFAVTVVMDPDRDGIDRAFRDFIGRHGQEPDNRLLFYYAGHGHTMTLAYGGEMGYLVPKESPDPNRDARGFLATAISMQNIEVHARNVQAKHALFVFDSCFSGAIFDSTRSIPEVIQAKTGKAVRQFITSGTAEQRVPDESIFRAQFVAALGGEADLDRDGYVTGAELGQFLETTVTNYSRQAQTPQYGKLRDPLLDKGDFVFRLAALPPPKAEPPAPSKEALAIEDLDATYVAVTTAKLRAEPKAEAAQVGQVPADGVLSVTGRVTGKDWLRVAYQGKAAFVFAPLVKEVDAGEVQAWAEVKDTSMREELEEFLETYPSGHFAPKAKALSARLAPPPQPAPPAPSPMPGGFAEAVKSLDNADRMSVKQTALSALEFTPSRQVVQWRSPHSGNSGTATPHPAYKSPSGEDCRGIEITINVGGREAKGQDSACRQPDGNWRLVSETGTVTPYPVFKSQSGQDCRDFESTINVGGREEKAMGRACRDADGNWKIVE